MTLKDALMSSRNRTVQELFDLTGRVAIVTGGAGLLGKQFSEALVEAGASVVVASRTFDNCRAWAEELQQHAATLPTWAGRDAADAAFPLSVDVTDPASSEAMVQKTVERFGRLDILVNNAYTRGKPAPPEDLTPEDWRIWVDAGLSGVFYTAQAAARVMLPAGSGSIINIGSIYGVVGVDVRMYPPGMPVNASAAYGAIKGGVVNLTRYLSITWSTRGVRVNCISPGGFPGASSNEEFARNFVNKVPLNRMGNRTDLKGAVVYLASDASAYVTGHNLLVDGGWTAW
jgi:NAD(P)-dependent dehydrogenase (short-subunit alcohol dehydrogenase family)